LGASLENLEKLAAAYWYTFEVGLCLEDDVMSRKILGGAVLSSIEESSIALGSKAKIVDFDLKVITNKKYRSEIQYTGI
jgi:phenylalanine-4-hydroxylase